MPNLFILAGPNGAGKSTSAPRVLSGPRQVDEFVNADVIAKDKERGESVVIWRDGKIVTLKPEEIDD